jgi:hypothetical protein
MTLRFIMTALQDKLVASAFRQKIKAAEDFQLKADATSASPHERDCPLSREHERCHRNA